MRSRCWRFRGAERGRENGNDKLPFHYSTISYHWSDPPTHLPTYAISAVPIISCNTFFGHQKLGFHAVQKYAVMPPSKPAAEELPLLTRHSDPCLSEMDHDPWVVFMLPNRSVCLAVQGSTNTEENVPKCRMIVVASLPSSFGSS